MEYSYLKGVQNLVKFFNQILFIKNTPLYRALMSHSHSQGNKKYLSYLDI